MDSTRRSIQGTVEELKERVGQVVDWRYYVERYPVASLGLAMAAGMIVGRRVGTMLTDGSSARPAAYAGTSAGYVRRDTSPSYVRSDAAKRVGESLTRVGTRLESMVNRMIDEAADTVERTLVPSMMTSLSRLLGGDNAGAGRGFSRPVSAERRTESSATSQAPAAGRGAETWRSA
jgi:hypothetical protein